MVRKLFNRRGRAGALRAERTTVGLAVVALGSLGALLTGEVLRMARRRRESGEAETPENRM